ncbi:hypothetical protein GCM10027599_00820 [Yimella radicis]
MGITKSQSNTSHSPSFSSRVRETELFDLSRPTSGSASSDAIEAHLTIVFAALAVARYLQNETGLSIKRIVTTLRPLREVQVSIAGHLITAQPQLTPEAEQILRLLGTH